MTHRQAFWFLRGVAIALVIVASIFGPWWIILVFGIGLILDALLMLYGVIRP